MKWKESGTRAKRETVTHKKKREKLREKEK